MTRSKYNWQSIGMIICSVLLVAAAIWAMTSCYQAGVRKRDAEPPRVVADKERRVEHNRTCSRYYDSDDSRRSRRCRSYRYYDTYTWLLISSEGYRCSVSESVYRTTVVGQPHKCMQIFGWSGS